MADKKISQLSNASTPLAGTEVLPIVQSSTTVKVAANDLTVKNVRSNATTGILQIAGPAAAATRTMTVPDANFTAARTDASNSFTADQTLATGNLVVGTSGKGIDFSANTGAAGMTSELLTWYEEGAWQATIKGGTTDPTTPIVLTAYYTRIGRQVTATVYMAGDDTTGASGQIQIAGLPFANNAAVRCSGVLWCDRASDASVQGLVNTSGTTIIAVDYKGNAVTWVSTGATFLNCVITYFV
jgi:hypothetical protein